MEHHLQHAVRQHLHEADQLLRRPVPSWSSSTSSAATARDGVASFMGAEWQGPEVKTEAHPTLAQGPEVSEPVEVLLTTSQPLVASEMAEAPLASTETTELTQPAPGPMPARGPGALCAIWSDHRTSWREVPPGRSSRACVRGASPHFQHGWALATLSGGGLRAPARSWACLWLT